MSAGPHGEIVQVSFADRAAIVTLTRQGEKVGEATVALEKEARASGVRQLFWRSDGGAAAVYVGHPPPRHPTAAGPPARHLAMISLTAATSSDVARADRGAAEAANSRGMKLYRAKDYGAAAGEFRRADRRRRVLRAAALQPRLRGRAHRRRGDGRGRAAVAGRERRPAGEEQARQGARAIPICVR